MCNSADADNFTGFWKDNNHDHVCNNADAHITYNHAVGLAASTSTTRCGRTTSSRSTRTASPCRSSASASRHPARSTSAPAAATTRCSTTSTHRSTSTAAPDSTSSSCSAPSSPTTSSITDKAVYGAGLNVKYSTVEVLEIDGLEGDDQFFVLSTAYGVAYRVIGGLGSDHDLVAGDVTTDIVTRELEGLSGAVDHIVTSARPALRRPRRRRRALQPRDPGHGRRRDQGAGQLARACARARLPDRSRRSRHYTVQLSHAPSANVYVTVSAAASPSQEANDPFQQPDRLRPDGRHGRHDLALCRDAAASACDLDGRLPAPLRRERRRRSTRRVALSS